MLRKMRRRACARKPGGRAPSADAARGSSSVRVCAFRPWRRSVSGHAGILCASRVCVTARAGRRRMRRRLSIPVKVAMRSSRYADFSPLAVFIVLVGFVFVLDHEWSGRADRRIQQTEQVAGDRVRAVADVLGNEVSARIGSVEAAKSAYITAGLPGAVPDAEAYVIATLD